MADKRKIVIAEDNTLLRESLRMVIEKEKGLTIVGEAADGFEAIRITEKHQPDLVLIDLTMPKMNGISAVKEIKRRCPKTRVLVMTIHDDEEYVLSAFESGADGYFLKSGAYDVLLNAIECVMGGKNYLAPDIAGHLLASCFDNGRRSRGRGTSGALTSREKEILKLIAEGYKTSQIADLLCISARTVQKHRSNMMHKLELHSTAALTAYAIQKDLAVSVLGKK
ncbi:MAG: DNA-binding response regulator [Desulfobacteraceae bacterium]|nr:MAG: DNA-binding response regulator [Desulfobacteraceae bacterium]